MKTNFQTGSVYNAEFQFELCIYPATFTTKPYWYSTFFKTYVLILLIFIYFCFKTHLALIQCSRMLFSEKLLRITDYETRRMRMSHHKLNINRLERSLNTNNTDALMEDIKKWIHIADRVQFQTVFPVFQRCLRHIHDHLTDQTKNEDDQTFNFGPLVMRMMHFFNVPDQALQVIILIKELFYQIDSITNLFSVFG